MEQPSEPESQIIGILNNMQIIFDRERTFPNLLSKSENVLLPVDFSLNINGFLAIIEYNGAQHYKARNSSHAAREALRRLSANGTARLNYCNKNNIPLLIIHYKDKGKLIKIISAFIDDVRETIHETTKSYTAHTKGYFKNIPYATFEDTPTGPIKPIQMHENDALGYINLSNDAIVWTKRELDTLLARIDSYEKKINEYKTVTADLVLSINELQRELAVKNQELNEQSKEIATNVMTKSEPKIKLQFIKDVQPSKKQKFTGKFRQTNSPRGRLTPEAKEFIKSLASQFDTVIAIQEHLKENYQEKVSLPTLKRCLL
ncbi:hypothetical protein JMJ99_02015 [Companilactobacillus zhachilii]|uniref:hypothetical protein n=1 Tax=Companilactobacillus zhachilii TaxID=2304606 RepID=UPI001920BC6D|nr:hypothetical protein [Companilactobacillus zhachilii]MBL3530128.1 hypothetical protein [Companilactobacillus zhachilii]